MKHLQPYAIALISTVQVIVMQLSINVVCSSAQSTTSKSTVFYELPRDQAALERLLGAEDAPAIVVRGSFNATESSMFSVRTSNHRIAMQVTKWSNPDCVGELFYSDSPDAPDFDQSAPACIQDSRDFAPLSTRSQIDVFIQPNSDLAAPTQSRFSFELVFTFYRTYTLTCDALRCSTSRWCIASSLQCDGVPNCEDGSDEWPSVCRDRSINSASEATNSNLTGIFDEYVRYLIAAALALMLVTSAIGIGLYCRLHRRKLEKLRIRELRRRNELAAHLSHMYSNVSSNGDDMAQPFLNPPDYRSVVRDDSAKSNEYADLRHCREADSESECDSDVAPPAYFEALTHEKAGTTDVVRPNKVNLYPRFNELLNGEVLETPSTSSSSVDFESPVTNDERYESMVANLAAHLHDHSARKCDCGCDCSPV